MSLLGLAAVLTTIGIPLLFTWRVWRLDEPTRTGWLIEAGYAAVIVVFMLVVARWDIASHYTRIALAGLIVFALVASARRHASRPWREGSADGLRRHILTVVLLAGFGVATGYAALGLLPLRDERTLSLPFEEGRFVVVQGGDNFIVNRHHGHASQRHAVDIVAVDAFGARASGFHPEDLERYAIFDVPIVSPCTGEVTAVRDGLPDLVPPESDPENAAGNHVSIACDGITVELAHLRNGSAAVDVGDSIETGDRVGTVGNSGNTSEPHLHIHAVDAEGRGVPLNFDGTTPVRNRMFRR